VKTSNLTYHFIVLTSLTYPRKIILVVLQATHSTANVASSILQKLSSLWLILEVRKGATVQRDQFRVFQDFLVKICHFLVYYGCPVRNGLAETRFLSKAILNAWGSVAVPIH
jgi:hypothetical protein